MSAFQPIPLGRPIPFAPHAVSCSLPTMAAVRGYEENDPATVRQMASGYPRFVVHPFARRLAAEMASRLGLGERRIWLTSSVAMARAAAAHLGGVPAGRDAAVFERDGIHGFSHAASPELATRAKHFLQNIGGFLSSREAEDHLVRLGLASAPEPETLFAGDAEREVRRVLRPAFPEAGDGDVFLAASGMNAVYAAFRALADLQAARGRTLWIQLGWLYLDTIAILKKCAPSPEDYAYLPDVLDRAALERLFAEQGSRIAGIITEIPTNPLIQTPDVPGLAALCRRHGARLILDPSIVSPFSVAVLPHADAVVCSLTKYTASEGDVIAGATVVNPAGPDAAALRDRLPRLLEPVYPRDLSRLAAQIGQTAAVLDRINASTARVAEHLRRHPAVAQVCWALQPDCRENYLRIARDAGAIGGMITFTVRIPLERFFDRVRLAKGPSFGMSTTLICPYMYLAHYDLTSTAAGRAELAASGLDPDLLRLCVGTEPVEAIIAALDEALS